ncbi:MAG: MarR family transcriptional regulator [Bdellovibrionaceae bacterium]|nr:MarR family transcriptional regulator [Pseudobdellovibrionaceae bacterium]MBX3033039.1 MarR family transcriptional regulator [Pseudobdellovibrionaceae bacterium]
MDDHQKCRLHSAMKPFLGYCFYKSAANLKERMDESVKPLGLVIQQCGILTILEVLGNLSQTELAEQLEMDTTSVVRFIDGLEKKKYVERIADPKDRRVRMLHLTPAGQKALAEVRKVGREAEEKFLSPLSAEERKAIRSIVPKLITEG